MNEFCSAGFTGFVTIAELRAQQLACVPREAGVYMIIRESTEPSTLVAVGTGGRFKGKDPNVPIATLESNWVDGTPIIYIGKAGSDGGSATLRSRLKQYLALGIGRPVGHWGGRFIWQLADAEELKVCWKVTADMTPREVERDLIKVFVETYGTRPFANLSD